MSDSIPLEIQMDIIQRIPDAKSVIRCRSVSKEWKSVIDSKDFVTAHTLRHQPDNRHHLLIGKQDYDNTEVKYFSIVDDDTFPHQKLNVFVPNSIEKLSNDLDIKQIIGTSHGLFCLYVKGTDTAVIWNPCIRKTVEISVPNVNVLSKQRLSTIVGFGVCPRNLDPKLVKITHASDSGRLRHVNAFIQVEVFTLSSGGTWRSPLSSYVSHKSIMFGSSMVGIDGFIYWVAFDMTNVAVGFTNLIMSFDLTSEELTEVHLPDCLALNPHAHLSLYNLKESLAVLEFDREICYVWMMIGHGSTRSFNKLYSIDASLRTLGFSKSGTPIVKVEDDNEDYRYSPVALASYEPESKSITNIGIHGLGATFYAHSYMETLLLLGQQ